MAICDNMVRRVLLHQCNKVNRKRVCVKDAGSGVGHSFRIIPRLLLGYDCLQTLLWNGNMETITIYAVNHITFGVDARHGARAELLPP